MTDKKFDPIDRDIIRNFEARKLRATPNKIARAINIHPSTAKLRIIKLSKSKVLNCIKKGNRLMCKVNKSRLKQIRKF